MKNLVRDLKGNKNQCRYSPQTMALAMSLYIKAGPSAYEQFKNHSVIVMPAATTLAEIRQKQGVRDGCCIAVYESQLLMRPTRLEIGQVMCDEMKLQKDVLINVKNGKIVGFSNDFVDMKKIVKNLLDEDEIESYAKPATHVNQWRYRAVDGRSFVCEFWYNHGELTGKGLLRQFNQVVMRCEEMGSIVLGMVCDAGGSNAGLFTKLREKAVLEEGGWVSLDVVRTKNPWEPSRFVYLFHCATHDLKAMRNAFFTSWVKNGKRRFLDVDGTPIAKDVIYNCNTRDRARESRGASPQSEVQDSTVYLTTWSKMNVMEAKRVFSWKTLIKEIADHLYSQLGFPTMVGRLSEADHGTLGFVSKVAQDLKEKLHALPMGELRTALAPEVSGFEWLANVHEIFIARLMNMNAPINWANIDR
jgi:hypothetical protein